VLGGWNRYLYLGFTRNDPRRAGPSRLSGGPNEEFTRPLIECRKHEERALLKARVRECVREIKG